MLISKKHFVAKQEVFLRNVSSTGQAVDSYWVKITPGGDVAQKGVKKI